MKIDVNNGCEKGVRWITVSQQGKLERRVQQQPGQKAQQCEHTNDDVDTLHFDESLYALFRSPWSSHSHSWSKFWALFTSSPCHPCVRWLSLFNSTFSALYFFTFLLSVCFSLIYETAYGTIHYSITIWFTNFSASSYKNSCGKSSSWQGIWNFGENFGVELDKSQKYKKVIDEERTSGPKVHFASLMDICQWKNAELEVKHQKYKGRVVFRVEDDSRSCAVFTEQGSSVSQMTAAKIIDIISRLPACAGQAADAVSACTHVKMKDAYKLLKIPKSECPDLWIHIPRHKRPKSWSSMEDPVVLLERNLYGHPLAGLLWERQFEKVPYGWEKIPNWECFFVHREKGSFFCVCGWHKIGWKEAKSWSDVETT